jgi:homospermidine synthase
MTKFNHKLLIVGYGAVAQCTLPILLKHIQLPCDRITVIDFKDKRQELEPWIRQGLIFECIRVTRENMSDLFAKHLGAGDLLIDLAWNIGFEDILQWCHDHDVLYLNTSLELWNPYEGIAGKHPTERTLYWRHMNLRRLKAGWSVPGPTAVVEHGANPGLISHFTKQGLLDIAAAALKDNKYDKKQAEDLREAMKKQAFNQLAMKLGVKVIHVSERDTQITNQPKQADEFVNTWSIEGFREEGTSTSEMGWGTHEKTLPAQAFEHASGPKNQICLGRMGINTHVVSWVPDHCIQGMVVRHGEAFTISDALTVWNGDLPFYRPTVHYAYLPCDSAIASFAELRGNDYRLPERQRIMYDDILSGSDIMGALLMGHPYHSWWTGSDLSIEEARRLLPHQNATTMQVAISIVAATVWMIENPRKGVCTPEDLPFDFILRICKPYLGKWLSIPSDWTPLAHRIAMLAGKMNPKTDSTDEWQFQNFLVQDGE